MTTPRTIREFTTLKQMGNSNYILVGKLLVDFMDLKAGDDISLTYDTKLKKITIRKLRKHGN